MERSTDPEANMWLNPQSWAVISGLATNAAGRTFHGIMYMRELNTSYGAILMDPPYHLHAFDGALAVIYNPGTKENAGIFSQSQGWLILAEALLGHGDRAFAYFMENAPSAQNDTCRDPEAGAILLWTVYRRKGQSAFWTLPCALADRNCFDRNGWMCRRNSWHASGLLDGLRIAPSIPAEWDQLYS